MSTYAKELARPITVYANSSLVAVGTPVNSGFLRLPKSAVIVTKKHTTGTYAMTIDWSNDGTNTTFTTTPALTDNTPLSITVLAPFAKFTITASTSNFTVHQTNVLA
jgi:hypothetical protein